MKGRDATNLIKFHAAKTKLQDHAAFCACHVLPQSVHLQHDDDYDEPEEPEEESSGPYNTAQQIDMYYAQLPRLLTTMMMIVVVRATNTGPFKALLEAFQRFFEGLLKVVKRPQETHGTILPLSNCGNRAKAYFPYRVRQCVRGMAKCHYARTYLPKIRSRLLR